MQDMFECVFTTEVEVKSSVSVSGGTDWPQVHLNHQASETGSDPWCETVWLECIVGNVLHPDKGGELGEAGDVEETQLCV